MDFHGTIIGNGESEDMAQIVAVKPEDVESVWPKAMQFLERALLKNFYHDEETLKAEVKADRALLLFAVLGGEVVGALIAKIERMKCGIVNILSLGGKNFKEWRDDMRQVLDIFATHNDCKYIVASSSEGFKRLWPDFAVRNLCYVREVF